MKKVLTVQDLSCVGCCSLTVALPVLSCCGVETSVLPTAVLSTHTGGFTGFTYRDLTGDLLPMAEHWKQVGCRFQSLYSGFLGSERQIGIVEDFIRRFRRPDTVVVMASAEQQPSTRRSTGFSRMMPAVKIFHLLCFSAIVRPPP